MPVGARNTAHSPVPIKSGRVFAQSTILTLVYLLAAALVEPRFSGGKAEFLEYRTSSGL